MESIINSGISKFSVIKSSELPANIPQGLSVYPIARIDGKKGKSGLVAMMTSISESAWNVVVNKPEAKAWLVGQVEMVRSKVGSSLYKAGKDLDSESVGIDALVAWMVADATSTRLTAESIGAWFDADLAGLISEKLLEKMTGISAEKLAALVAGYRTRFVALAGRSGLPDQATLDQMAKALALLPDDYEGVIAEKVALAMIPPVVEMEALAGL
jgi:hypothetical protein